MDSLQPLQSKSAQKYIRELLIWLKYSMFFVGIVASISFIRVNYFGAALNFTTGETPVMFVPNAVVARNPEPEFQPILPAKKK